MKYKTGANRINRALYLCTSCVDKDYGKRGRANSKLRPCKYCQKKHYNRLLPQYGQFSQRTGNEEPRKATSTLVLISSMSIVINCVNENVYN